MALVATQDDQTQRLRLMMCCLGTKGDALATKLRLGKECECDINMLALLTAYWDILVCYDPSVTTNCLTQTQIDLTWEHVSKICGLCFAPYGSTYSAAQNDERITEGNEQRITEAGETRIVEDN